jgi:hypothetical protein
MSKLRIAFDELPLRAVKPSTKDLEKIFGGYGTGCCSGLRCGNYAPPYLPTGMCM